jgi:hypothetical protein
MNPLPAQITDDALIGFIDQWAALLEREDYQGAYEHTAHVPEMGWTAPPGSSKDSPCRVGELNR